MVCLQLNKEGSERFKSRLFRVPTHFVAYGNYRWRGRQGRWALLPVHRNLFIYIFIYTFASSSFCTFSPSNDITPRDSRVPLQRTLPHRPCFLIMNHHPLDEASTILYWTFFSFKLHLMIQLICVMTRIAHSWGRPSFSPRWFLFFT